MGKKVEDDMEIGHMYGPTGVVKCRGYINMIAIFCI